jgi:flagellar hook-length control protein FliK
MTASSLPPLSLLAAAAPAAHPQANHLQTSSSGFSALLDKAHQPAAQKEPAAHALAAVKAPAAPPAAASAPESLPHPLPQEVPGENDTPNAQDAQEATLPGSAPKSGAQKGAPVRPAAAAKSAGNVNKTEAQGAGASQAQRDDSTPAAQGSGEVDVDTTPADAAGTASAADLAALLANLANLASLPKPTAEAAKADATSLDATAQRDDSRGKLHTLPPEPVGDSSKSTDGLNPDNSAKAAALAAANTSYKEAATESFQSALQAQTSAALDMQDRAPATAVLPAAPSGPTAAAEPVAQGRLSAAPGSADFAPQLGAQLSRFVRDGIHHAQLELNPTEMGPLTVQIQLDGNSAHVHMAAEHMLTREALEQAMPQLASSLREAGLTLTGGGVSDQARQSAQDATPDGRNSRGNDTRADRINKTQPPLNSLDALRPRRRGVVDLMA